MKLSSASITNALAVILRSIAIFRTFCQRSDGRLIVVACVSWSVVSLSTTKAYAHGRALATLILIGFFLPLQPGKSLFDPLFVRVSLLVATADVEP